MPREINNFRTFNEANIRNNKGLDPDYIDNIRDSEIQDAHRKVRSGEVSPPMEIMGLVRQLMSIQGGELSMGRGGFTPVWRDYEKKATIEQLARDIISDRYGNLLDTLNVEMDIELVDPSELDEMKQGGEMSDSAPEMPEYEETDDEDLRDDVDKRKIANIITQGSAKNVHRLIHMYRDKIDEVDDRLFTILDRLIKSQEAAEWLMAGDDNRPGGGSMIRQHMNGFSKVEFESPEDQMEFEEMADDIDMDVDDFNTEEAFEEWDGKIKVTARGIDLVILLHESVKGIYEILGSPSIPEFDVQRADDILINTDTLDDEHEDLRYGPKIREDLLNWVNTNDKVNQIDDGFEYVWGAMISVESGPFLDLFFDAIIGKTGKADKWLDNTLDKLIQDEEEFKRAEFEYEQELKNWETQKQLSPEVEVEDDDFIINDTEEDDEDYSKMSQRELGVLRDKALDNGDFDTLKKISQYLK